MECIFTVISNLVSKAQSPDDALAMADQIANKLTVQPVDKPVSRLKMYLVSAITLLVLLRFGRGCICCSGMSKSTKFILLRGGYLRRMCIYFNGFILYKISARLLWNEIHRYFPYTTSSSSLLIIQKSCFSDLRFVLWVLQPISLVQCAREPLWSVFNIQESTQACRGRESNRTYCTYLQAYGYIHSRVEY